MQQKKRCENPRNNRYKYYGAKGISVRYNLEEFIDWWESEEKPHSGRISIDRIDKNKHYEFGNIQLISCSENSKKRIKESGNPNPPKKITIIDAESNDRLMIAIGSFEAQRLTGVDNRSVRAICLGNTARKTSNGYRFSYE